MHFACETIGNELIIPGRETPGTAKGLPTVCRSNANCRGSLGTSASWFGCNGAAVSSEMTCQSESSKAELVSSTVLTEVPMWCRCGQAENMAAVAPECPVSEIRPEKIWNCTCKPMPPVTWKQKLHNRKAKWNATVNAQTPRKAECWCLPCAFVSGRKAGGKLCVEMSCLFCCFLKAMPPHKRQSQRHNIRMS